MEPVKKTNDKKDWGIEDELIHYSTPDEEVYTLNTLKEYMLKNNLTSVHVHTVGINDLLAGNENSLVIDADTSAKLGIDVDGDMVYFYQLTNLKEKL